MGGLNANPAASVRQRLLDLARRRGDDFQLVLARYGAERFLYRLGRSEFKDRFVLKGAMLFVVWWEDTYRPTRDLDLLGLGRGDPDTLGGAIARICAVPCPEDGLVFDADNISIAAIREEDEYGGLRVKLVAYLGKTRIPLQIDVGFGDKVIPRPRLERYPTLLDLPAPRVKVYPRETMVAEKFEAMVRLGAANSRMKDFYDLAALAASYDFEGSLLREAVKGTFERRRSPAGSETPSALRSAFYSDPGRDGMWRAFLSGNALRLEMPGRFEEVGELLIAFLKPVWESLVSDGELNATWTGGGPWRTKRDTDPGGTGE
ncbi:MAG: nucleotidyl transferase AbiEii/AbiGii toxin family protein [Actinobacteria bacterium]|nr:nucleotidyl transferase AbiEii/AbiGii toxin family protein [Actinomycetota bacterium]